MDIKIQAICPIMTGQDEFGEVRNQPLFWILYLSFLSLRE
ncbi:hypothetical protein [Porphyromonas gingivalis]|nr:hypothetical protein [Porphyromonas gingivalis]